MDTLAAFLKKLRQKGTTLFIIEHNMRFIMSIAERIVVLDAGAKFREGTPGQIQQDKEVQRIYLGEEEEA
jgi:branched-chain amino acid transport system ATP-binding protein